MAALVLDIACGACAMREGMNLDCEWPSESVRSLDLHNPTDLRHLVHDVEVAEELGIRYADRLAGKRPVSVLGIQVRTGLGGPSSEKIREGCTAALLEDIATIHRVGSQDVLSARSEVGNRGANLPVNVPMALFTVFVATTLTRRVHARFEPDEKWATGISIVLLSIVLSGLNVLLGFLWAGVVEMVRVGNEHGSYRVARIWWRQHPVEVFALSVLVFWVVAALTLARRRQNATQVIYPLA